MYKLPWATAGVCSHVFTTLRGMILHDPSRSSKVAYFHICCW